MELEITIYSERTFYGQNLSYLLNEKGHKTTVLNINEYNIINYILLQIPDIFIIYIPDSKQIPLICGARKLIPDMKIIGIFEIMDNQIIERLCKTRIQGYLMHHNCFSQIHDAIDSIYSHNVFVDKELLYNYPCLSQNK